MKLRKRWIAAAVTTAAVTAGGLAAYAAWTANGSGTGAATAIKAQSITITPSASGTADLYPGKTGGSLYMVINNPNPYAVSLTTASYGTVTGGATGCASSNVTVDSNAPLTLASPIVVPAGATNFQATIPGVADMSQQAPDQCQGATFNIVVTLGGLSQ